MSLSYGEQGQYSRAVESPEAVMKAPAQINPVCGCDEERRDPVKTEARHRPDQALVLIAPPGACFLDYDNDGKIDIFLTDNGVEGGMSLYRNLGKGKFEDVTKRAGTDSAMHAISCTAGRLRQ